MRSLLVYLRHFLLNKNEHINRSKIGTYCTSDISKRLMKKSITLRRSSELISLDEAHIQNLKFRTDFLQ